MKQTKCIYCLQEKEPSSFNKEHIIPRMFGKFENNLTLCQQQVCKECNTLFSETLENLAAFDSLEAFYRNQFYNQNSHDYTLGETRLKVVGKNNLFLNLPLNLKCTQANEKNFLIEAVPCIGFIKNHSENEYEYFSIKNIPQCTNQIMQNLKRAENPIIIFNLEPEIVLKALNEKGYHFSQDKISQIDISNLTQEQKLIIELKATIDYDLFRLYAKVIFNGFCYIYGHQRLLNPIFNNVRNFIINKPLKKPLSINIDQTPNTQQGVHILGSKWKFIDDKLYLCGYITWFGKISYLFTITDFPIGSTIDDFQEFKISFNTLTRKITIENHLNSLI